MTDDEPTVRLGGAAKILGVTRQRAYELSKRDEFPAPLREDDISRIWRRVDVEAYAAARKPATTGEEGT